MQIIRIWKRLETVCESVAYILASYGADEPYIHYDYDDRYKFTWLFYVCCT